MSLWTMISSLPQLHCSQSRIQTEARRREEKRHGLPVRCSISCREGIRSLYQHSELVVMETGLVRPSQNPHVTKCIMGTGQSEWGGLGGGLGGRVLEVRKTKRASSEGPSGAGWRQAGCHLNNIISSARQRTITGVHFTT